MDLFTLLRQAAKDGAGYVNLPLVDKIEAQAKEAKLRAERVAYARAGMGETDCNIT